MGVAPGLSSSFNDVCMGSTSMGEVFRWQYRTRNNVEDPDWRQAMNAREIRNMGDAQVLRKLCVAMRMYEPRSSVQADLA